MLLNCESQSNFETKAIKTFEFQYHNNIVYKSYCDLILKKKVSNIYDIPFLPIKFFKSHKIICSENYSHIFKSSGTQGVRSKHYISDINLYINTFTKIFESNYGKISDNIILGLLPSYLEQGESSLVFMVNHLINESNFKESGFFLNNYDELYRLLNKQKDTKVILFGVSYALLDFIEKFKIKSKNLVVIETGGMKGKRKEITRDELHMLLKKGFQTENIHSEYGMTELLSQAYSKENGIFKSNASLKVFVRDINNPLSLKKSGKGALNFIDLSNINSCSFVASEDVGEVYSNGDFKVLGRMDESEIRGCNLMFNQ